MATTTATRPEVVIKPSREDWQAFFDVHRRQVDSELSRRDEEMRGQIERLKERRLLEGAEPTHERLTLPTPVQHIYQMDGTKAADLSQLKVELVEGLKARISTSPTQLFYPAYAWAWPVDIHTVEVQGYWYPVVIEEGKSNGYLELGAIASKDYGEQKLWDLHYSEAKAGVGVSGVVAPSRTTASTIHVTSSAHVSGLAEGWALPHTLALAAVTLELDVTVFEPSPSGYVTHHYATSMQPYSKFLQGSGVFYDSFDTHHVLSLSFQVAEPDKSVFVATMTGVATAVSSDYAEDLGGAQCPLAVLDLEGYDTPPGIYYLKGGGILVPGFVVTAV